MESNKDSSWGIGEDKTYKNKSCKGESEAETIIVQFEERSVGTKSDFGQVLFVVQMKTMKTHK